MDDRPRGASRGTELGLQAASLAPPKACLGPWNRMRRSWLPPWVTLMLIGGYPSMLVGLA